MLLRHLELRRLCQYSKFEHDFAPGLIGVMGPNGIGKSNLVNLIKASVTNDFRFKGRTKEQQIRRGTSDDKQASIATVWEHGGTEFEIIRSLQRPKSSTLKVEGEAPLTKTPEIQKRLQDIIGVPETVMDDYVFVGQGEILKFLSEKPAVRKDNFAQLCGAGHIERIWDSIGDRIRDDAGLAVNFVDNSEDLKLSIRSNNSSITIAEREIEENQAKLLSSKRIRYYMLLCSKSDSLENAKAEYAKKLKEIKECKAVGGLKKMIELQQAEFDRISQWLNDHREGYHKDCDDVKNLVFLRKQKARYELLCSRRDVEAEPKPERPQSYVSAEKLYKAVNDSKRELREAEKYLDAIDKDGVANCPTCGTLTCDLEEHTEEMRQRRETLPEIVESGSRKYKRSREYEKALREWQEEERTRLRVKEEAEQELARLKEVTLPNVAEANERNVEFEKYETDLEEYSENLGERQRELAREEGRHEQLEKDLAAAKAAMEENAVDETTVTAARAKLHDHESAKAVKSQLESNLNQSQERLQQTKEELRRVQALKSRTLAGRKWLTNLESWREVVHRDNFPRIYMASVLEDLVDQVNELLNEFDGPFYVSAGDDLSFTVHNPDGTSEPAASKSGGEMVVLAIAYRLAVNSRFARDVGLMVLDEPSAFLDQKNLGCLASVLQRICEVMKQRRQQLIMITHDQRLERVFDQLIELG